MELGLRCIAAEHNVLGHNFLKIINMSSTPRIAALWWIVLQSWHAHECPLSFIFGYPSCFKLPSVVKRFFKFCNWFVHSVHFLISSHLHSAATVAIQGIHFLEACQYCKADGTSNSICVWFTPCCAVLLFCAHVLTQKQFSSACIVWMVLRKANLAIIPKNLIH